MNPNTFVLPGGNVHLVFFLLLGAAVVVVNGVSVEVSGTGGNNSSQYSAGTFSLGSSRMLSRLPCKMSQQPK
jgi:hypothetical protein